MAISSLTCKLQVMGLKNMNFTKQKGSIFIRIYIPAGNNTRIQLSTREINIRDYLFWGDDFSLECSGTEESVTQLSQQSVVFELRLRKTGQLFGRSQLLARAEMPWKKVLEAPMMEVETWVAMNPKRVEEEDGKPPALRVAMKVEAPAAVTAEEARRRKRRGERVRIGDECGSLHCHCCSCVDNDLLFVAAAFEAF